jgi:hypothetical protein
VTLGLTVIALMPTSYAHTLRLTLYVSPTPPRGQGWTTLVEALSASAMAVIEYEERFMTTMEEVERSELAPSSSHPRRSHAACSPTSHPGLTCQRFRTHASRDTSSTPVHGPPTSLVPYSHLHLQLSTLRSCSRIIAPRRGLDVLGRRGLR